MGFDLSGMKPKQNTDINQYKLFGMVSQIENFEDQWKIRDAFTEEDNEQYWKEYEEYHDKNPGLYFRNNVWWWRPLWSFVCQVCDDFLNKEDIDAGNYNDHKQIDEFKAKKISKRLRLLIKDGTVEKYEKEYGEHIEKLKESNNETKKWNSQYPFNIENVERFATFCEQSGGFVIG